MNTHTPSTLVTINLTHDLYDELLEQEHIPQYLHNQSQYFNNDRMIEFMCTPMELAQILIYVNDDDERFLGVV